jgi:hypothetical protein
MTLRPAAIGFAPHSGWAAMVVLCGAPGGLRVLARSRVELVNDRAPESKQPYHEVESMSVEAAAKRLCEYMAAATSMARSAVDGQCKDLTGRGYRVRSIGILDSASRKQVPLSSILASHALIHAAEGDHFRNALAAAAEQSGLSVCRMPARNLEETAAALLRISVQSVRDAVKKLGIQVGAPWGADQKQAALLAWLLLGNSPRNVDYCE